MKGGDGGCGPWTYLESEPQVPMEEDIFVDLKQAEDNKEKMKQMVQEFFLDVPSANCGNMSVLERWFTELGVAWVLHFSASADDDAASALAGRQLDLDYTCAAQSWIQALAKIMETIRPRREQEPEPPATQGGNKASTPDQLQLAQFIHNTLIKMLAFVDALVSSTPTEIFLTDSGSALPYEKISTILGVHSALSRAIIQLAAVNLPFPAELARIHGETVNLFSSKEGKTGEVIWSIMEQVRTELVDGANDWFSLTESSDIHEAARSVMGYIGFLGSHYKPMLMIVSRAVRLGKYVPRFGNIPPLDSMMAEIASSLEERLANRSESSPDQSQRFLFLLNNSNFIKEKLCDSLSSRHVHEAAVTDKVEDYIQSYIQVSWEPTLSCMFSPKRPRFGRNHSPLHKFESEFQKIYSSQKQWKVPDPVLRKRLRKAITEKIVGSYRKGLDENKVTSLKFTPQELEEMLQELFEG